MNPMMLPLLPFIMYQQWLEKVFLPFVSSLQGQTSSMMNEAKSFQDEAAKKTKGAVQQQADTAENIAKSFTQP